MASERLSRHIERLLDEADEALTQRRWDVVRERAQDILSIDPENSEGVAFLAAAERALGSSGAATEGPPLSPSPAAPSTSSSPVQPTISPSGSWPYPTSTKRGGSWRPIRKLNCITSNSLTTSLPGRGSTASIYRPGPTKHRTPS